MMLKQDAFDFFKTKFINTYQGVMEMDWTKLRFIQFLS